MLSPAARYSSSSPQTAARRETSASSEDITMVMQVPARPARPVRPERWTKSSRVVGAS